MTSTPVFIICSPKPRVGKTLLARLLCEYLLARHGEVLAFDLSVGEPSLVDHMPRVTETADIGDTFGQMQLMDRLIVDDAVPKVIDLGVTSFEGFFTMCEQIGFAREARMQGIAPCVMFLLGEDRGCARAYARVKAHFPKGTLIAVSNDGVLYGERPSYAAKDGALEIGLLPDFLKGYVAKAGFSFAAFAQNKTNKSSELYDWIRKIFLRFREIELQMMLK